jgi:L-histidine N-alpha-methyltransferase
MDIGFRARERHRVRIDKLDIELPLDEGEQLRVEVSAKFRRETVGKELGDAGLITTAWWTDEADDFALLLAAR